MNERVVEILVYIMSEIRGKKSNPERLELISRDLLQRGYSPSEISFAFSWLFERYSGESEELLYTASTTRPGAVRILHEAERAVLSTEAYGYLLQLKQLRLLSDLELEQVIERALMTGAATITLADIKTLVAGHWFNAEGSHDRAMVWFEDKPVIH
ncbi:MAG: DUF494 domain-containing protein [candidate division KSB1 bacterium]|nr:DUF494 domain-containing protein [candidate division KSB1 bacterium]MDZ7275104.1 DUF494 domain-containing protein [candidate division KSB1 bacterium]MDZ7286448.1 DUF494 domain-containing protein [candidate division KSB1 bacterium]MDZ7299388.1 DUF494 domain-containing protein [candidate division KSB1 bacterium]MDZ7307834.1 DUF494 domain-containing protein [candidate division KSB1 bacterium]